MRHQVEKGTFSYENKERTKREKLVRTKWAFHRFGALTVSQNPDHTEDTQEVSVESLSCVLGFRQLRSFPYDRGNEECEHGDRNGQRE